jgi:cysteine desulfurase
MGAEVDILPGRPRRHRRPRPAAERITDRTGIVAAMLVNNEIGVIQPVAEIAALRRARRPVPLRRRPGLRARPLPLNACDMVASPPTRCTAPKGIGALWVREGVQLDPLLHGGGQEGGVRSGTLSPALCAGFGAAAHLLVERLIMTMSM